MSLLDGSTRKQLRQAILEAFPTYEALEQLMSFELNVTLGTITHTRNCSDAIFEVIQWAEARGQLSELIQATRKENPTNPKLRDFDEQVWQPLLARSQSSQNILLSLPEVQILESETNDYKIQASEEASEKVVPLDQQKRTSSSTISSVGSAHKDTSLQQINTFQESIIEAHNIINATLGTLQLVHKLFQGDETIYKDQCQLVCDDIRDMIIVVQQLPTKLSRIPIMNAALRYLLHSEKETFVVESESVKLIISRFHQVTLLRVRQDIQSKLTLLIRSLREIDRLIGEFDKQIEQNGKHSQFDQTTEEQ